MAQFYKLKHTYDNNCHYYEIPKGKTVEFHPLGNFESHSEIVKSVFDFAYNMSFGKVGEHRPYRTGGKEIRKMGQIFTNAFQGKIAEFALYEQLKLSYSLSYPDLEVYDRGKWDLTDLKVQGIDISVKSTKHYGNLLLLEEGDWDSSGFYIPNNKQYAYHFLVRLKPDLESILKGENIFLSNSVDKNFISNIIFQQKWTYDIPGYITNQDLVFIINNNYVIKQGSFLNKIKMDASNYYVKAYDMNKFEQFFNVIQNY